MNTLRSLLTMSVLLIAQFLMAQSEYWRHYRSVEQVNEMAEQGSYLWMATNHGVVQLDKNTHETKLFTKFNSTLIDEHVASVAISPEGDPWIGTYDVVLMRWNGTEFENMPLPAAIASQVNYDTKMYCIRFAPNGDMWVGTDIGAIHKSGDVWEVISGEDMPWLQNPSFFQTVWDIRFDDMGNTFMASNHLVRYDGTTFTNLTDLNGTFSFFGYSSAYLGEHDGYVYYVNDVQDAGVFRGDSIYINSKVYELAPTQMSNGFRFNKAPNGELLLMSNSGAPLTWELGSLTVNNIPFVQELSVYPEIVCTDASGLYWATKGATLYFQQNSLPGAIKLGDELTSNEIRGIVEDEQGKVMCLAANANGASPNALSTIDIYDYTTDTWTSTSAPANTSFLRKDYEGRIWMAAGAKIYRNENNDWVDVSAATNQPAEILSSFSFDVAGDHIWISYNYKLYHFDGTAWQTFTPSNSGLFPQGFIQEVVAMPDGSAYIEQYNTADYKYYLHHISNTTFTSVNIETTYGSFYFSSFHLMPNGELWGADFSKLYHFNADGTFNVIGEAQGWLFNGFFLSHTNDGKLLIGTAENGVAIYDPATGSLENIDVFNSELTDSFASITYMDSHGTMWIGVGQKGLDAYNPAGFAPNATTPTPQVKKALDVMPNPTDGLTNLAWQTTTATNVALIYVFDAQGKHVQTIPMGSLTAGKHSQVIDLSTQPSGVYRTILLLDGHGQTGSIIKQ